MGGRGAAVLTEGARCGQTMAQRLQVKGLPARLPCRGSCAWRNGGPEAGRVGLARLTA